MRANNQSQFLIDEVKSTLKIKQIHLCLNLIIIICFCFLSVISEAQKQSPEGEYIGIARYETQKTYKLYKLKFFKDKTFIGIKRNEELCYFHEDTARGKWKIANDTISFYDIEQKHHIRKGVIKELNKSQIQVISKCVERRSKSPTEIFMIAVDSNENLTKINPLKIEYVKNKEKYVKITDYYFNSSDKPIPILDFENEYSEVYFDSTEKDLLLTFEMPDNAFQLILYQNKEYSDLDKYFIERGLNLVDFKNYNLFVVSNCIMSNTAEFINPLTKYKLKSKKKLESIKPVSIYGEGKQVLILKKDKR